MCLKQIFLNIVLYFFILSVVEPGYLNCPSDIQATLPSNANEMALGSLFQLPQTNINTSDVFAYPDNVGPSYKFRFGKTLVSYIGTHESGQQLSCSFFVDIKGNNKFFIHIFSFFKLNSL